MSSSASLSSLDPRFFPDRDACVYDVQQAMMRLLYDRRVPMDGFGPRSRMILERSLQALYEYNAHPDTSPDEMLGVVYVPLFLDDRFPWDPRWGLVAEGETFRERVLSRVSDSSLLMWFRKFESWPAETSAEAVAPLRWNLASVLTLDLGDPSSA